MKILHTADWHLGQKFYTNDRIEEHQLALKWLVDLIEKEKIDVLIIAGDIFDVSNPPNYAQQLYYDFFKKLLKTSCQHTIIIGGNHDSPAMLNAPKGLLEVLNIKVVSAATESLEDEIIELKNEKGELQLVIAAVPFLRDRDLKNAEFSESGYEKADRIKEGIYKHYNDIAELCKKYDAHTPIIATGHLYAKGAQSSDKQDNIYLGNIENISSEQFSSVFDYIALGHIHRAQSVGNQEHIRYSGSLLPLSFSEIQDKKSVTVLDFEGKKIKNLQTIDVPSYRKLVTFRGDVENVKQQLTKLDAKLKMQLEEETKLRAWVEIILEGDTFAPNLEAQFDELIKDMYLEKLRFRTVYHNRPSLDRMMSYQDLKDMTPKEVFEKRLETVPTEEREILRQTFQELLEISS
jgi:DNA repair protein SbcD/Mre11